MLESIHIRSYRSLRDFRLRLGNITVITGPNGVGKSNLYRALAMMQRMAAGNFASAIAAEGGMPALLWAGDWKKNENKRVSWELTHADFRFALECGLIPATPGDPSEFKTDPDMKSETLHHSPGDRLMASRKGTSITLRTPEGKMETTPLPFHSPESMLSEVRDSIRFPALSATRETLLAWRFYHQFRTDPDSPMRRAQVGFWSPVLSHDGTNLAATLQTLRESARGEILNEITRNAFPDLTWTAVDSQGTFQLQIEKDELKRSFTASELSDGTLRFFCLCAALLSEKPPPFLVLNEPETSLHSDLIEPLANLIAAVPDSTQILIVTHSHTLAGYIAALRETKVVPLTTFKGQTRLATDGTAKRAWVFDD